MHFLLYTYSGRLDILQCLRHESNASSASFLQSFMFAMWRSGVARGKQLCALRASLHHGKKRPAKYWQQATLYDMW
jgi:hypothetical protein